MWHKGGVDWCIGQHLGQHCQSTYRSLHRSSVKQCRLSVDSIHGSVSAMYQWAISQLPIRYRRCNVQSTIFINCTNFFSNLIPKAQILDWSVTCTKSQAIFTYRSTYRSSVGRHINCYWSSGGRESVTVSVGQCPTAVDRGIGCNVD